MLRYSNFAPLHASGARRAYFTTRHPSRLDRLYHQPAHAILLCQCITHTGGTGISTCCPSPTTIVLGLGPDLPWADEPSPGNLGLSTCKFLACISLLIPAFSLLRRPALLSVCLLPAHDAPLPLPGIYALFQSVCFAFASGGFPQPFRSGSRLRLSVEIRWMFPPPCPLQTEGKYLEARSFGGVF